MAVLEQRRRGGSADAYAEAGVLVSMLAHVAAHRAGLEQWGATDAGLRETMARLVFIAVAGQRPPVGD